MSSQSTQSTNQNTSYSGTSNTKNGTTNQSQVNPWSVQQPFLTQAFSGAAGELPTAQGYLPSQLDAFARMLGYGTNMSVPNSSAAAGAALSSSGADAASRGLYGLAGYDPSQFNNASNVLNTAKAYMSGVDIPGQVKAAMQPAEEEANYVLNPGIDASMASGHNVNSSRDAIEHGLVASRLGETAANLGATIGSNAWNTGTNLGETMAGQNALQKLNSILGLTQGGTGAATAGTAANSGSVGQAGGLGSLAQLGSTGLVNTPFQALQNFYNIIGANNWGSSTSGKTTGFSNTNTAGNSTTTGTTTYDPSQMAQIGGWLSMAGSLI